jgi:hypothetical protein
MEGKASTSGVVASGGIDNQDLRGDWQGAHGLLEQRPFPEGEQRWQVGPTSGPAAGHALQQAAAVRDRRASESSITGGTDPLHALEADEAGANPSQGRRRLPAVWCQLSEGLL